jgi:hypothetical protein
MVSSDITIGDLAVVTGYSRDKLKGFLRQIGFGLDKVSNPREATVYSRHELLTIAACAKLEEMGMRRSAIKTTLIEIARALSGPRSVAKNPRILVRVEPISVSYVDESGDFSDGFVLPLRGIFSKVDVHLGVATPFEEPSSERTVAASKDSMTPKSVPLRGRSSNV